jgi:hypothetical protein
VILRDSQERAKLHADWPVLFSGTDKRIRLVKTQQTRYDGLFDGHARADWTNKQVKGHRDPPVTVGRTFSSPSRWLNIEKNRRAVLDGFKCSSFPAAFLFSRTSSLLFSQLSESFDVDSFVIAFDKLA